MKVHKQDFLFIQSSYTHIMTAAKVKIILLWCVRPGKLRLSKIVDCFLSRYVPISFGKFLQQFYYQGTCLIQSKKAFQICFSVEKNQIQSSINLSFLGLTLQSKIVLTLVKYSGYNFIYFVQYKFLHLKSIFQVSLWICLLVKQYKMWLMAWPRTYMT